METFPELLALCGEFSTQRPVTQSFDVFCDLRLNKRLSEQSRRRWFETSSHSLWRHCNGWWNWQGNSRSTKQIITNKTFTKRSFRGDSVLYRLLPDHRLNKQVPYFHYDDVRMGAIASQITSLMIVYSIVYSDVDQRKHQSSASLAFVWGIHRGPVNSPHKWPVTR